MYVEHMSRHCKRIIQRCSIASWRVRQCARHKWAVAIRRVASWAFVLAVFEELARRIVAALPSKADAPGGDTWTKLILLLLASALVFIGLLTKASAISREATGTKRLHAIRSLQRSLDLFRKQAREAKTEQELQSAFEQFIRGALVEIDEHLFPDLDVALTLMREADGELRIIGYYPEEKEVNADWALPVGDARGYARLAYEKASSVYLPKVKRDWGIHVYAGNTPGEEVRYGKTVHRNLWAESGRMDFRTLLSTPTSVVTALAPSEAIPFGVLNVESQKSSALKSDHFYSACAAASILGQAMQIDRARRERPFPAA
jgi:hypothetical protein